VVGFSRYHNFKFELNGIRVWRAYGVGKGKVTPYQDIIVRPQGPTDLVVDIDFCSVKETRFHNATSSDDEQSSGLFSCSEPGCKMVVNTAKNVGAPKRCMTNSEETGPKNSLLLTRTRRPAAPSWAHSDEQRDKNEACGSCSVLQLGWALHKPRSQAVRFTDEVKKYLTMTIELATKQIQEK